MIIDGDIILDIYFIICKKKPEKSLATNKNLKKILKSLQKFHERYFKKLIGLQITHRKKMVLKCEEKNSVVMIKIKI